MAKGGLDIAKLAERLAQLNKGGGGGEGGVSFIDIKDGRNVYRILPPINSKAEFAQEVWVHYGVGKSATSKGTMIVCPRTENENGYCPMCELSSQLKKMSSKKDDQHDKDAKQAYRKKRVYYNAIDRTDDLAKFEFVVEEEGKPGKWMNTETGKPESPVKVLATGVEVYKALIGFIIDPEYGDITDPEVGLDIIITKTGSGQFNTNYDVKAARKESAVGYDAWEKAMNDLAFLAKPKSVPDIEALMEGKPTSGSSNKPEEPDDGKPVDISEPPADMADESDTASAIAEALARRKAQK